VRCSRTLEHFFISRSEIPMAEEIIKLARSDAYATISLNRPEKRNALSQPMLSELQRTLELIEGDKAIRAVVLRGEGSIFCSGIDLQEVERVEGPRGHQTATIEGVFHRLENLPIPTIAAINGAALAGGLELALHCDLRIAAEGAKLGMTLARVGLVVPYDFTRKLIEIIGSPATAQLLFTADTVDARRALEMGMVHEVVEPNKLVSAAESLAQKVSSNAPLSLRAMKATIRRCMSTAFDAEHKEIDQLASAARRSKDAQEGVRAFLEKRKPVWRGE
jgi:enoyl-CoA hydratase/carnithine racemase